MKIAMLPGHARKKEGATVCAGYYEGFGEHALASHYLPGLCLALEERGYDVVQTQREDAGGTSPSYSAKAANATGANLALEWHFNSCEGAEGCEVLHWHKSAKGKEFAEKLSARLAKLLGVRNRGAKAIGGSTEDRGYHAFRVSRMPFYMIEPCFAGSNEAEARAFGSLIKSGVWQREVAKIIAVTVAEVYGKE